MNISKTIVIATLVGATLLGGCATGSVIAGESSGGGNHAARVEPGMTKDEVRQVLGAPEETERFPRSGTEAWNYGERGYYSPFAVTFGRDGRVSGTLVEPAEG
jgi:outer membrane protein assembly factor BamE (lipoprotein component of BamABCDE complex)